MGIPAGIVINRDTGKTNMIDEYAEKENIPVILKIPFDRNIAKLYSEGKIFAQHLPEWKKSF
ncbi:hypothetical protein [Marinitoga lauensis]|uniref:hypothetical protein n=1 Tax=Marinitoga lauensis TaxID=2201189 RepID=UPI00197F0F2A|nr:hypothetical protein [Marinitoga lauensis]